MAILLTMHTRCTSTISVRGTVCGTMKNERKKNVSSKNFYDPAGWVNAETLIKTSEPFVVALGGRGIGKTYGILKYLYQNKIPFIYMRRTQTQLDAITVQPLNPFNQIAADIHANIAAVKLSKHTAGFYDAEIDQEGKQVLSPEPFGIAIALSTFASIRSLSAEKYQVLVFDEIIPEKHEKPIKEEGLAFANVIESLNRNRELQHREPLKVILITNANSMNSKILAYMGCVDVIDSMVRHDQKFKSIRGLIAVFRFVDSPISEQKRNTVLYQVMQNSDFTGMSIDNKFSDSDFENVQPKPLQEYKPVCSIGSCLIMKHKSKREYYCIAGSNNTVEHYEKMPLSIKAFQRKYYYIYGALLDRKVFYQNVSVKMEIEGVFKNG